MEEYCNIKNINIQSINKKVAKQFIIDNHYTHKWSLCRIAYGIYYNSNTKSKFFESDDKMLIGCLVYGQPVGRSAASSLSDELKIQEVLELTRLFIHDGYGKNIESYCIAQSFKLLNRDFPNVKAIISYSDCEQGHTGVIYQATGFIYQGNSSLALMPNYSVSLNGPPDFEWMHSRNVTSKWGSCNIEHLKKVIGKTFYRKKESKKHRYVKFISTKLENKRLLKSLKHPILPYPKTADFSEEIEKIEVSNNQSKTFF
jgi:hypothetical protein